MNLKHLRTNKLFAALLIILGIGACSPSWNDQMELAESLQAEKRSLEAIAVYQHALESSPQHPEAAAALDRMARVYYFSLHQPQKALDIYRQLLENYPDRLEAERALEMQAKILEEQEAWNLAIESYARLVERYPKHERYAFFQYRIGELYRRHGDLQQAELELNNYLKKYPHSEWSDEAHFQLGELYFQTRRFPQALAEYKNIIETFPESPHRMQAQFNAGLSLESIGEWDEALNMYRKLLKIYPNQEMLRQQIKKLESRRRAAGRG